MANWVRKFKFTYEHISGYTGISEGALRQRLARGLDLHDVDIFMDFMNKYKKEVIEDDSNGGSGTD